MDTMYILGVFTLLSSFGPETNQAPPQTGISRCAPHQEIILVYTIAGVAHESVCDVEMRLHSTCL